MNVANLLADYLPVICWYCGRPIHEPRPLQWSMRGYCCFMHGMCAFEADKEAVKLNGN